MCFVVVKENELTFICLVRLMPWLPATTTSLLFAALIIAAFTPSTRPSLSTAIIATVVTTIIAIVIIPV